MADITRLNVYLAQIEVVAGQPSKNLATIERHIQAAKDAGAHLVVFPEMCVGGYFLADKWTDDAWVAYLDSFNDRIRALSDGIGVIWGNVGLAYRSPAHPGTDGRPVRYNMAYFASNGAWVPRAGEGQAVPGHYIKTLQPNYRAFDDDRYFCSALMDAAYYDGVDFEKTYLAPFEFEAAGETYTIGLQVCEDLWSGDYPVDPTAHYTQAGCDLIVNISASPWTYGKDVGRDKRVAEHVRALGSIAPLVYVNAVGMQNTGKTVLSFDGGSSAYNAQGTCVFALPDLFHEEGGLIDTTSPRGKASVHRRKIRDIDQTTKLYFSLTSTLHRFDEQVFPWKPKWIIGLSGGIDSSVTAALLLNSIYDRDRIVGYNLATRYNSDVTKANAYQVAEKLGIRLVNGSIEALVQATDDVLAQYGYDPGAQPSLVHENAQARIRGHMLSTFAQVEGGVIMNNGNKVETLLGYATLYGDAIGAISPLGDVTKAQLFDLARFINEVDGDDIIPERLIPIVTEEGMDWECPPSAELANGQVDPMKWFYHDWLVQKLVDYPGFGAERVMRAYAENRLQETPVAKWVRFYGLDADPQAFIDDLEWVLRQMRNNVFKRLQAPPIIAVSRGAFGNDFRENQCAFEETATYAALKAQILNG